MCIVSMVTDEWHEDWKKRYPGTAPNTVPWKETTTAPDWESSPPGTVTPTTVPPLDLSKLVDFISREEFNKLKKEIKQLRKTIKAAKKLDEAMGQNECEKDEKIKIIKDIAKAFGVNFENIFDRNNNNNNK